MLELALVFRNHALIRLLDPGGPNVDPRPQTPNLQKFLNFEGFIESQLRLWIK